jgi:Xaa-Pro aminopeptidase
VSANVPDRGSDFRQELVHSRTARLRKSLGDSPYEALLLTSPEAVDYATGYRSVAGQLHAGYGMAAVVTPDRTLLVLPAADTAPAIDGDFPADHLVPYGRFYFSGEGPAASMSDTHPSYQDAVLSALRTTGRYRLGIESSVASQPPDISGEGRSVVDATDWMLRLRAVKLPAEQALLRRAAELAEDGIEAALTLVKPGVTERELAAAVASAMVQGGGVPRFVVVTVGARSALADAFPTDNRCSAGDLVRFDVGCQLDGYWSDIARTAVVGGATPLQQRRYDALLAGLEEELHTAKDGVSAGQVFDAAVGAVQELGLEPYRRHHAGHAIGLSVYESPVVRAEETTTMTSGMVFCLETPYYELGWGGMMVEDTGVVTAEGFELFTSIDRSLRVVP